jgi:hypothetical protein
MIIIGRGIININNIIGIARNILLLRFYFVFFFFFPPFLSASSRSGYGGSCCRRAFIAHEDERRRTKKLCTISCSPALPASRFRPRSRRRNAAAAPDSAPDELRFPLISASDLLPPLSLRALPSPSLLRKL